MSVNPYFTVPSVSAISSNTAEVLDSVTKAEVASQENIALKNALEGQPKTAGTNYGGPFQQGQGTSFNIDPTKAWHGAGAVPQYTVAPDGRIVPYVNFLDKTAGAGMSFGLPPSVNDVEANLKRIDPYAASGASPLPPPTVNLVQETAQLKQKVAELQNTITQFLGGTSLLPAIPSAGGTANPSTASATVDLPLVGGGVA